MNNILMQYNLMKKEHLLKTLADRREFRFLLNDDQSFCCFEKVIYLLIPASLGTEQPWHKAPQKPINLSLLYSF